MTALQPLYVLKFQPWQLHPLQLLPTDNKSHFNHSAIIVIAVIALNKVFKSHQIHA